ncbi:ABC transporter permease [Verrucomicrobia bacterium LW23]|nr:ABC transporter permease [Verrucomicrobia bacterium LW23]
MVATFFWLPTAIRSLSAATAAMLSPAPHSVSPRSAFAQVEVLVALLGPLFLLGAVVPDPSDPAAQPLLYSFNDRAWLIVASVGYLINAGWGAYALGARISSAKTWNLVIFVLAFAAHCMFLHLRGEVIRRCPITNLFEIAAFFSWSLVLTYLVIGSTYRMSILGTFTAPVVFTINFCALVLPIDVPSNRPPLGWQLELHATLCLLGFATLGVAALAGVMYLIQERQLKRHELNSWFYSLPAMGELAEVHKRVLLWGFAIFFAGTFMGFFVRHEGMLDWIKIAWTLVICALYLGLLLAPRFIYLSQKKIATFSVASYIFVLLTFWGVNAFTVSHRLHP